MNKLENKDLMTDLLSAVGICWKLMKIWRNESQEGEKLDVVITVLLNAAQLGLSCVKTTVAKILFFSLLHQRGSRYFGLQALIGLSIINDNNEELLKAPTRAA